MTRLRKLKRKANYVGPFMHEIVEQHVIDGNNYLSMREQADLHFVIAKRLIADLPLVSTNDLIYTIVSDMYNGLYDDLGPIEDANKNWPEWVERCKELCIAEGKLWSTVDFYKKPLIQIID